MLAQILNLNMFAFLLVFARLGTAFSIMPGFSSNQIPMTIRLTFALVVCFLVTPVLTPYLPAQPAAMSSLTLLIASEILIGGFLGIIPRVFMGALQTAGTILAMVSSLANMFVMDPIADQQSSLLSSFLGLVGLTLVFVTNTHHLMLAAAVDSYSLFEPVNGVNFGDMSDYLAHSVSESFRIGVQLASPLILSAIAYYLGLGIMGRLMPQLPVFFFGMPIQISLQIFLILTTLPAMMMVFMRYFEDGLLKFVNG
ncbi:MAG: flagellar biosynthetic protein FliR [Alphaproteobacteria bacterium]|nr:flagellar biosynthetic protein FliR [Alphaproteobacteria bacterium]MBF0251300.1 flagellar biosynthetic protein FliR [Alphaproteobacteria bacterium]